MFSQTSGSNLHDAILKRKFSTIKSPCFFLWIDLSDDRGNNLIVIRVDCCQTQIY